MARALAYRPEAVPADVYREITNVVLTELDAGHVPWVRPWTTAGAVPGLPHNPVTGRTYAGINILALWRASAEQGFASQAWLTSDQIRRAGGAVRAGETGTVAYAGRFTAGSALARAGERDIHGSPIGLLGRFSLLNVAQCRGLPDHLSIDPAPNADRDIEEEFHELIAATGMDYELGGVRTFYMASRDIFILSDWRSAVHEHDFDRDWLHALIRATGHSSRLNRDLPDVFGHNGHGFEDLVAELGCAFVCAVLGIEPTFRHPDHIAAWIEILRGDDLAFARAASAATTALDYLLSVRDAQAAAIDRLEAEDAEAERALAARDAQVRQCGRRQERERWAFGSATGSRPGESLLAARHGGIP
jgi:antirestriction protein ArdC